MEDLLLRRLLGLQLRQPLQPGKVLAVHRHDPLGRVHAPQVGRAVVAERAQELPRLLVLQRRGVEEELGVVHALVGDEAADRSTRGIDAEVVADRGLEIADSHVVADRPEVGLVEAAARALQVGPHAVERVSRAEPRVDRAALPQELRLLPGELAQLQERLRPDLRLLRGGVLLSALGRLGVRGQLPRQLAAARQVDVHPEQAETGRGHDLREPRGVVGAPARDHVGATGALEQNHPLHRVGVDPVGCGGLLDQVRGTSRSGERSPRPRRGSSRR